MPQINRVSMDAMFNRISGNLIERGDNYRKEKRQSLDWRQIFAVGDRDLG